jgi:dTDP-4-amino-4,6-dideoxygalactose transaminase
MFALSMNLSDNSFSDVNFYPVVADGLLYPEPVVPGLPTVSLSGWARHDVAESAFMQGESFVQGRYALAEALRRAGAQPGKVVLLPALHCRVMVEPVMYLKARPVFYPLLPDLRPDFDKLSALLEEMTAPVVALVLTHYFGFQNALNEMAAFCKRYGIALIEDCAHAFYGQSDGRLLGTVGDYAIASPWKFLPVRDGGVLRDNTGGKIGYRQAQPWLAEAKALAALLQIGWNDRYFTSPELDAIALDVAARRLATACVIREPYAGLQEFRPEQRLMSGLRGSRCLMSHAAHGWIAQRRRDNYQRWLDGVRDLPSVTALFPSLPEGVVPYAFPVLIDEQGLGFHLLKLSAIPIWRWEDMAVSDCAVARDYRIRLLQLPCHQSLRKEQLDWMIATLRLVLIN